jgi:chromosome segregation ATPase
MAEIPNLSEILAKWESGPEVQQLRERISRCSRSVQDTEAKFHTKKKQMEDCRDMLLKELAGKEALEREYEKHRAAIIADHKKQVDALTGEARKEASDVRESFRKAQEELERVKQENLALRKVAENAVRGKSRLSEAESPEGLPVMGN